MNRTAPENLSRLAIKRLRPLAALCVCLLAAPAMADDDAQRAQVSNQISAAIDSYIGDLKGDQYLRIDADVQPLDSRMLLAPCQDNLQVEHTPKDRIGGRITFKVSCPDADGWSVRIPANLQLFDNVVVAAVSIPMGTQLTDAELSLQEMDVALLYRGYYRDVSQVKGFVSKRPIPAGQVLSPVTVNPANVVSKGETVAIIAEAPGLKIRALGVSLMDGAMGDVIQVRNTKTNKVVEGRVSGPGQIQVPL